VGLVLKQKVTKDTKRIVRVVLLINAQRGHASCPNDGMVSVEVLRIRLCLLECLLEFWFAFFVAFVSFCSRLVWTGEARSISAPCVLTQKHYPTVIADLRTRSTGQCRDSLPFPPVICAKTIARNGTPSRVTVARKNTNCRRAIGFRRPCSHALRGNTGLGRSASDASRRLTMLAIGY
jgi:hypothetical protein